VKAAALALLLVLALAGCSQEYYFLIPGNTAQQVGPFVDAASCEKARAGVNERYSTFAAPAPKPCWRGR
jgi:hypothetical protein